MSTKVTTRARTSKTEKSDRTTTPRRKSSRKPASASKTARAGNGPQSDIDAVEPQATPQPQATAHPKSASRPEETRRSKDTTKSKPKPAAGKSETVLHDVLLNALPHPVLVIGPDAGIVYANSAAEAFFSVSVTVMRRQKLQDIVAFGCPLLSLVAQVQEHTSTVNEYGVEMSSPRFTASKLVDVYAGPMPDIPEQTVIILLQRTMAQMIERQFTHRAAARSVSGMASILAHEIKNPLSGIRGAAQLLESNLSSEERPLAQLICSETDRIRDLVERMEVFGDERPVPNQAVNIHDVLDHVRDLALNGFAKHVTIAKNYDPSLPPVPGSRDLLIQAFLNLVKNAVEAIPEGTDNGRIVMQTAFRSGVRLTVPGGGSRVTLPFMIQIEDNGTGIPESLRPNLFDPFVTTKQTGTGLGLSLVAKIIGDHGGLIECESEPGHTVFRVLLPFQEQQSPAPPPPSNTNAAPKLKQDN